jgi:hypothetical protein
LYSIFFSAFHEAVGEMVTLAVTNPDHLQRLGLFPGNKTDDEGTVLLQKFENIKWSSIDSNFRNPHEFPHESGPRKIGVCAIQLYCGPGMWNLQTSKMKN